jgi:hypothetical protein
VSDEEEVPQPTAAEPEVAGPEPATPEIDVPEMATAGDEEEALREAAPLQAMEEANDAGVEQELRALTRRGFFTAAVAAGAGWGAWHWLRTRPREGGVEWPLRRFLEANEALALAYFSRRRLSPTFSRSRITAERVNGGIGLAADADPGAWQLQIMGGASPVSLTMEEIRAFPRREMITELRCIEGWSIVVRWAGTRLADVMARYPPPARDGIRGDLARPSSLVRYVAMETPGRGYYVGLDMPSALHPQTLLAYEMNGHPLTWQHGAPLRLAIPVKYGIKNIKRIGVIRYTDVRPADYWGDQGYDWYAGH